VATESAKMAPKSLLIYSIVPKS